MQTPSVGRIVHYVRLGTFEHEAAIITNVVNGEKGTVGLVCFPPRATLIQAKEDFVLYDARTSPGTWHYPEVVNTVSYHESENEAEKREGPISNSPEIEEKDYPDPEKNNDEDYEDVT